MAVKSKKSNQAKPTIFGIRPKDSDMELIRLIRQSLSKNMSGVDVGDALVVRYALQRTVEADNLRRGGR